MTAKDTPTPRHDKLMVEAYAKDPEDAATFLLEEYAKIERELSEARGEGLSEYDPCGGCGQADPDKRCIGCLHPFSRISGGRVIPEGGQDATP